MDFGTDGRNVYIALVKYLITDDAYYSVVIKVPLFLNRHSIDLGGDDCEFDSGAVACMSNRVVTSVRILYTVSVQESVSPSYLHISRFPQSCGLHLLFKSILHTNTCSDINSVVEFLSLHIASYVHADNGAGLVFALDAGSNAPTCVERRLPRGTSRTGNVEGVAACCCCAHAAEALDFPSPRGGCCARIGHGGGRAGGEESKCGDLGEHFVSEQSGVVF